MNDKFIFVWNESRGRHSPVLKAFTASKLLTFSFWVQQSTKLVLPTTKTQENPSLSPLWANRSSPEISFFLRISHYFLRTSPCSLFPWRATPTRSARTRWTTPRVSTVCDAGKRERNAAVNQFLYGVEHHHGFAHSSGSHENQRAPQFQVLQQRHEDVQIEAWWHLTVEVRNFAFRPPRVVHLQSADDLLFQ